MSQPISRPFHRASARRGSALAMTMILCALATVLAITTLSLGTQNRQLTQRSRDQADSNRAALSAMQHLAAQVQTRCDNPNVGKPDAALNGFVPSAPTFAMLGIDSTRYDIDASTIEVRVVGAATKINTTQFSIANNRPETDQDPDANSYIDEMWSVPIRARVRLIPAGASTVTSSTRPNLNGATGSSELKETTYANAFTCTMEASMQFRIKSLFQFAMFFDNVSPWLWGGSNTYRGGIHSNYPIFFWASGSTEGARVQIERVSAPKVYFRNYGASDNLPAGSSMSSAKNMGTVSATDNQAIYISRGDLNGDGKLTAYASTPNSAQWNSQNDTHPLTDEYRPAYRTKWDTGAQNEVNNFWKQDATTNTNSFFRIDSDNPSIGNLSTLFNGNYKDDKSGFQPVQVSSLATTDPRTIIAPPDISGATPEAAEKEKFSNKAQFYLFVETAAKYAGDAVPRVRVFTSAAAATTYKNGLKNVSGVDSRATLEAANSASMLTLPPGIVETNRRFIDYTQQKQTASDTATPRISAVDIDMSALRTALGTSASPTTTITTANGAAWNPNAPTGWNGIVYAEVDDPVGTGWSATTPPVGIVAAPVTDAKSYATANLTAVRIHNASQLPDRSGTSGYSQSEGLTLATNTVVYTVGNINADGLVATDVSAGTSSGSTNTVENGSAVATGHHFPFAIAADAVTVMSAAHKNPAGLAALTPDLTLGDNLANTKNASSNLYYRETFTELNFGTIGGGGNPNANYQSRRPLMVYTPARWDANDIRYRGSIVTLFESKYSKKWAGGNGTQQSKSMDIGFDRSFGLGFIPPGIPRSQSSVLVNFAVIATGDFTGTAFPAPSRLTPTGN